MLRGREEGEDGGGGEAVCVEAGTCDVACAEAAGALSAQAEAAVGEAKRATATGAPPSATAPPRPVSATAAGAGLGAVTGVLGVGGGFLAVPALVGVLRLRMRAAIGTSLLVITLNTLAALALRTGTADGLDWGLVAPFTGAAVLGAWDGKRLSGKVSGPALRRIFAVVLLAVAAAMLVDAVV